MTRFIHASLALLLGAAAPAALPAQERIIQGGSVAALGADDPRARRVAGFLEPLLRGDAAAAEAYLKQHAAPGYDQGEDAVSVSAMVEQFGGGLTLGEIRPLQGDNLLVELKKDGQRSGMMLRVEPAPPHRIVGFVNALIRMQRGSREPAS